MAPVSFTRMSDGTQEDYDELDTLERSYSAQLPERILAALNELKGSFDGYQVSRFEHSLQSASRAHRDGRDTEYVVMALVHDIGDGLAPYTHGELAGAILRPFVRPEVQWIAKHHGVFQLFYYGHFRGENRHAREAFRDSEYFDACVEFCEKYDQESFDPGYPTLPIELFEPMIREIFAEPRYLP